MNRSLNHNLAFESLALQDSKREVIFEKLQPLVLSNVYVTHSGLSLRGIWPLEITFFNNISLKRKKSLIRYTRIKRITEKKIRGMSNAAFIHHIWSSGYHHWVCECLLKATYLDPEKTLLYIPIEYPSFAFESLRELGFQNIQKIPVKTGVKCKTATFVPNPTSGHFQKTDLDRIRKYFFAKLPVTNNPIGRKIFISRSKAGLRKIKNEATLHPILQNYGYEIIHTEDLSFREQIELFRNCQVVVSIHGAGLTNCLFMPEGSTVFEIYRHMKNDADVMNLCYYRMSVALNLNYAIQFAEVDSTYEHTTIDRQDLLVDVIEFEKNLTLIESRKKTND